MITRRLIIFATLCASLTACTKTELDTLPPSFKKGQTVTISASSDITNSTRVTGTDDGTSINFKWEEGDKILVMVGGASSEFTIKSGTISADGKSADFEGTMPAEGNSYDVQYPASASNLHHQTYVEGGIASGLMQFGATNCTTSSIELQAKTAILQLNFYTTAETIGEELGDPITLNSLTQIVLIYETQGKDYFDTLFVDPAVELETSADKAKPFYLVVHPGVAYKNIIVMNGTTPNKSNPTLNDKMFSAGTCISMPAHMLFDEKTCLAAGTRITMADGSTKKVEDIREGDMVRTFDHEAGCISSQKVCLTYKGDCKQAPLNLTFKSGKTLSIVGTHDLLFKDSLKYIRINSSNAKSYLGKQFYNAESGNWDTLVEYALGKEPVEFYCIYSAYHLNCIAQGMLTCPDDVDYLLNIYELDSNLKADPARLNADIQQYGLLDVTVEYPEYAEFATLWGELQSKYVRISIGKGLITKDDLNTLRSYWDDQQN